MGNDDMGIAFKSLKGRSAFTLVELLVAIAVAALLLAALGTILGFISQSYNRSSLETSTLFQARFALDKIGRDLDARPNRSDLPVSILSQAGNDAMLFYAAVPSATPVAPNARGLALVAYRINQSATGTKYELQRAANGVSWDATSPLATVNSLLASSITPPADDDYDTASEAVFRMECSTINTAGSIKAQAPSDPSDFSRQVSVIVVTVAALDLKARAMLTNANSQLALLVNQFSDAVDGTLPAAGWTQKLNNISALSSATGIPVKVLSSIRISTRTYHVQ
jgi:prepilin-type N-terminal cleavage/methylation domain-containing protein